jgi:hypothetical protein
MTERNATVGEAVERVHAGGRGEMVKCPAHADGQASLHVSAGKDQPVVLHCHAGCQTPDILNAAGLEWDDISTRRDSTSITDDIWTPAKTNGGVCTHVYDYVDEEGTLLYQVLRVRLPNGGKTFFQRRPDDTKPHGWNWSLGDVRRVLYRLPEVVAAVEAGRTIHIMEGEKDVETARVDGLVATCNGMGAGKWEESYSKTLDGAHVVIVADVDKTGREHARAVAESLMDHEASVRVVETSIPKCKDYTDHRAKGGLIDTMVTTFDSEAEESEASGLGINDMINTQWDVGVEIIPGYLARANVVVVTGFEGHGKSLMLRQIAVCCASGINPFTLEPMQPLKVLFCDAENPEHQQVLDWRKLVGLAVRLTGRPIPNENLTILSEWQSEPDLSAISGQAWLLERVQAHQPDLMIMGPVQNIVSRDVKEDEVVRKLKHAVAAARAICGTAFILEHHAPWRQQGDKERSPRPYGSSLFNKWPDFGYGIKPDKESPDGSLYHLEENRKPRVRSRGWPEIARWGRPNTLEFPWVFEEVDLRYSKKDPEETKALQQQHLHSA